MNRRLLTVATLSALTLTAASCGSTADGSSGAKTTTTTTSAGGSATSTATSAAGSQLDVVASFYPLEYVVQRIGGDHVSVTTLTKPGVEPHELELTPQDVAKVGQARLTVYAEGFQPAVDKAVKEAGAKNAYDAAKDADLSLDAPQEDEGEHKDEHGGKDPHFWLDPQRYAKVAKAVAAKLGEADAAHKADYVKNGEAFAAELTKLDGEFSTGLKACTTKDLVTSHAAFGYLAQRYGLTQQPIAGLSPEQEPDAAHLAEITTFVKEHKVSTIYTETLASPAVAETVAKSTGAQTAVLDPIEGINDKSAGKNYLEVMRSNLATLKKGQSCA